MINSMNVGRTLGYFHHSWDRLRPWKTLENHQFDALEVLNEPTKAPMVFRLVKSAAGFSKGKMLKARPTKSSRIFPFRVRPLIHWSIDPLIHLRLQLREWFGSLLRSQSYHDASGVGTCCNLTVWGLYGRNVINGICWLVYRWIMTYSPANMGTTMHMKSFPWYSEQWWISNLVDEWHTPVKSMWTRKSLTAQRTCTQPWPSNLNFKVFKLRQFITKKWLVNIKHHHIKHHHCSTAPIYWSTNWSQL